MNPVIPQFDNAAAAGAAVRPGGSPFLMGQIGPAQVHVNAAASEFAVRFSPNNRHLIADAVCPVLPVAKLSDRYFRFDPANNTSIPRVDYGSSGGTPPSFNRSLSSNDLYQCLHYGLRLDVPMDVEANADAPLDPVMDATADILDVMALAREARVASLFTTSGNYGTNTRALSGAQQWSNPGSNPVQDITNALASAGLLMAPTVGIFSASVWQYLSTHPTVERYILSRSSTSTGPTDIRITPEMFADRFGLDKVYVAKAKYNGAAPGATLSMSYVWGLCAAFVYVEPAPAMRRTGAFAYTMRWNPTLTGMPGGTPYQVSSWYERSVGAYGATRVQVVHADAEELVGGQYSGYLFTTPVAS